MNAKIIEARLWAEGLCFGEGPRWRDGCLFLSDMHADEVLVFDTQARRRSLLTLPDQPSGLGWLPTGELLVVSMTQRRLLRFDGSRLTTHADLSALAPFHCNDMVVAGNGRAYVGNFGFDLAGGETARATNLIAVEADGTARIVADDLMFPNGSVITPAGNRLIVAESFAGRLTAFDIDQRGDLQGRRLWAQLPEGAVPDGISLDEAGGIWVASPSTNECLRIEQGGRVTHRIASDRGAYACMLGTVEGRPRLFVLTAASSNPATCRAQRTGQVLVADAPHARAGAP